VNNIIHLSSTQVQVENLHDGGFNFGAPALKFKRVTEYCQWQQFSRDEEDRDGNKVFHYLCPHLPSFSSLLSTSGVILSI
jgi:hypothetical protein